MAPKYAKFKEWLTKGAGLHEHHGILNRNKTTYKISTYIAILPDYKGFEWVFATNIKYDKIFRYVRYYKKRLTTGGMWPSIVGDIFILKTYKVIIDVHHQE